ncbi:LacI family DNA-binding transcriptional regulator [Pantoea eucrina]|uniref:LacI family DNA-binding transcriptional regulator n=1 Tax=Pantoea eucrina TaxID=472693 RepID=UPI003CF64AC9
MSKVTLQAIAAAAGVGVATVDRVLNNRAPVRPATALRVRNAAQRLGYRLARQDATGVVSASATLRMGFILLPAGYSFYQTLQDALRQQALPLHPPGSEPLFYTHDIHDVASVVASLYTLAEQVDVIALVALDHPLIRHAIEQLSLRGMRIYALFSDFSPCGHAGYFGLDNQKAGRTAGWLATHLLQASGTAAVLTGDHRFTCQESCEISFRSYLREQQSALQVPEPLQTQETRAGGYQAASTLLAQQRDLTLIYAPCGGIEGVIQALREQPKRKIALICHGPVEQGELALIAGEITVMLRHNLDEMAAHITQTLQQRHIADDRHFSRVTLPFDIVTRENL